jgi:cyclopropane-fatty-acyl-phospholipid synthase
MDAATSIGTRKERAITRLMAAPFHRILDRIDRGLEVGAIDAILPDGTRRLVGGHVPGPLAQITLHRWRALWRLVSGGSIGWYEAWEAGDWSSPDPVPIFDLFMRNRVPLGDVARAKPAAKLMMRAWHRLRRNDRKGARRNIAAHYDLGNDFYRAWLDPTLTYSSGMGEGTLEQMQRRKLARMLERTGAKPGDRVLEIGCGWGSFAMAASAAGVGVHALTLSTEQRDHVQALRLPGVTIGLTDYRDATGTYDGVASIEMVEAVGPEFWATYLGTIARVLKPGGHAAIQYITIADDVWPQYAGGVDFIQRCVFPGGSLIHEATFRRLAEEAGLSWEEPETFGLDYAETLRLWREAFDQVALPPRFDERFQRLWRYYLMYCEGGFRGGGIDVAQVTLVKRG